MRDLFAIAKFLLPQLSAGPDGILPKRLLGVAIATRSWNNFEDMFTGTPCDGIGRAYASRGKNGENQKFSTNYKSLYLGNYVDEAYLHCNNNVC